MPVPKPVHISHWMALIFIDAVLRKTVSSGCHGFFHEMKGYGSSPSFGATNLSAAPGGEAGAQLPWPHERL